MEMIHSEKSLEDIFLELTEDVKPVTKEKKKLFRGKQKAAENTSGEEAQNAGNI